MDTKRLSALTLELATFFPLNASVSLCVHTDPTSKQAVKQPCLLDRILSSVSGGPKAHISLIHLLDKSLFSLSQRFQINTEYTKAAKRGTTLVYSVLHPWRPVDDVTSIH